MTVVYRVCPACFDVGSSCRYTTGMFQLHLNRHPPSGLGDASSNRKFCRQIFACSFG
jgi:hypothetical protein